MEEDHVPASLSPMPSPAQRIRRVGELDSTNKSVDGYGNEIFINTQPGSEEETKPKKSISRSTVELGYKRAREMNGVVKGPKALGIPGGGSHVYSLLWEFGVIQK